MDTAAVKMDTAAPRQKATQVLAQAIQNAVVEDNPGVSVFGLDVPLDGSLGLDAINAAEAVLAADPKFAAAVTEGLAMQAAEEALPAGWLNPPSCFRVPVSTPTWRAYAGRGGVTRPVPVTCDAPTRTEALWGLAAKLKVIGEEKQ